MKIENELSKIKGITKEEVKKILEYFPTKERIIQAIALNEDLPFEEETQEALKKHYQEEANLSSKGLKKVLLTSNQPDIVIARSFNPSFRLKFVGNGPVETTEEVAVYLEKTGNFKRI